MISARHWKRSALTGHRSIEEPGRKRKNVSTPLGPLRPPSRSPWSHHFGSLFSHFPPPSLTQAEWSSLAARQAVPVIDQLGQQICKLAVRLVDLWPHQLTPTLLPSSSSSCAALDCKTSGAFIWHATAAAVVQLCTATWDWCSLLLNGCLLTHSLPIDCLF